MNSKNVSHMASKALYSFPSLAAMSSPGSGDSHRLLYVHCTFSDFLRYCLKHREGKEEETHT